MSIKIEKALLVGLMHGRIKLEDVKDNTGWVRIDAFTMYLTPGGVHFDFRGGGDVVATLDHPANLEQGAHLTLASDSGFEMRFQLTLKE